MGTDRRRVDTPIGGPERRKTPVPFPAPSAAQAASTRTTEAKPFYTTAEVAEATGLSQTTLLLWIRNKVIDGSRIRRSVEGRRLWTREDINEIERVKAKNGWVV